MVIGLLSIIFGVFFILFLPGFLLSLIFIKKIDNIERITLSIGLSIALMSLVFFYIYKIGINIRPLSSFIIVFSVNIMLLLWLYSKDKDKFKFLK